MTWLWNGMSVLQSRRATCPTQCHQHTPVSHMDLILPCSLALDHTTVGDLERNLYSARCWWNTCSDAKQMHFAVDITKWQHQYLRLASQWGELPTICFSLALALPGVNGSLLNISLFKMAFRNGCLLFFQWIHLISCVVHTSAFPISGFAFVVTMGESLWKMLCYITLPPGSNELLRKSWYC